MNSGSGKRVKNNLVALGSAAVLTVYSAGYFRTRSAAQRFEGEDAERRPAASTPSIPVPSAAIPATVTPPASKAPRSSATPKRNAPPAQPTDTASSAAAAAPTNTVAAPAAAPVEAPASPSAPKPATDSSLTAAATPAADSATHAADKLRAQLKDGTYSGWGTSRHGDIQAAVQIEGGRIISAYITQCLTRYSCSWISHLPPQVVTRQSPDVDYVSGATQSTNAFYYAVFEALSKAK